MTGVCLAFAILTFYLLYWDKRINPLLYIVAPITFGLLMMNLPLYIIELIHYILGFCNFPISFIVSIIVIRFSFLISRYFLKNSNSPTQVRKGKTISRNSNFQVFIWCISIPTLTTALILIGYGPFLEPFLLTWVHGVAFAELLFCFLFTIICDNGIISDCCLTALYASLYLSPIVSSSSGYFTVFLRLLLILISLISFIFSTSVEDINEIFPRFNKTQATVAMVLTFISYLFLSPDAFIRPTSIVCNFQVIFIPLFYIYYLLHEAYHYHTFSYLRGPLYN